MRPDEERNHFDARRPPEYTGSYGKKTMTYREPLPEDCPPDDAWEITGHRAVYRLVRNNPPTDDDFRSQRAENPHRVFHRVTECQSRGLSVFADQRDAERQTEISRLKELAVCRVDLFAGAGRIQKTGGSSHYTWWPYADYDILTNCRMVSS